MIVVGFPRAQSLDITGPFEAFDGANRQAQERGAAPPYRLVLASRAGGALITSSALTLATRRLATLAPRATDTVIVAGGADAGVRAAIVDGELRAWLRRAAKVVRRLASVCSGAFVLAAAGLLDGLPAATHWSACDALARFRPAVAVDRDAIFVRAGRIWTSAGVTTGIDMALAMVEEDLGRAIADTAASRLVLYARRPGFQSQWSDALLAQASAGDPLAPAIAWARGHLGQLDVPTLARRAGLSLRTLHRRCVDTLATTPAKLIERLRVEHARGLLAARRHPAKLVAARSGFADTAQLARAFRRTLGLLPRDYAALLGPRTA